MSVNCDERKIAILIATFCLLLVLPGIAWSLEKLSVLRNEASYGNSESSSESSRYVALFWVLLGTFISCLILGVLTLGALGSIHKIPRNSGRNRVHPNPGVIDNADNERVDFGSNALFSLELSRDEFPPSCPNHV